VTLTPWSKVCVHRVLFFFTVVTCYNGEDNVFAAVCVFVCMLVQKTKLKSCDQMFRVDRHRIWTHLK